MAMNFSPFYPVILLTVALNTTATAASAYDEADSARVAVFHNVSIGCMRSTSGVCHVLIKSGWAIQQLDIKGGTVGASRFSGRPIEVAVGSQPLDPKHCVFHKIVNDDQMVSGPD